MFSGKHALWAVVFGCVLFLCGGLALAGPVDINTADAATLARELTGIGLKRAQSIVDYRQKHGPFRSVDELRLVKGIGPVAIDKNRDSLRIGAKGPAGPAGAPAPRAAPGSSPVPGKRQSL
jgi:competence protein ComEA